MRTLVPLALGALLATSSAVAALPTHQPTVEVATVATTTVERAVAGCPTFPANNYWHADIRKLTVHPRNRAWRSHMSVPGTTLRGDFGAYSDPAAPFGLPITVVDASHPTVTVTFANPEESDAGPYPLGDDTRIEGGPESTGDRRAIVVDRSTCRLYETFQTEHDSEDGWLASNGATWDLTSNQLRPQGWASADLAGFPVLPGLLRWSEVRTDSLDHALRFVTDDTSRSYVWPARHGNAIGVDDPDYPPMGARFRLRGSFSAAGFSTHTRVVIRALKRYGMVLVDRGQPWYVQGEQNPNWSDKLVTELRAIPASAFVAVDTKPLMVSPDSARARRIS